VARGDTKERIVEVAIELFNQHGTPAVSTNHIAEAAGISPGNLYYHFRNKEEIILAAYERALAAYDDVWERAGASPPAPETMLRLLQETFDAQWRFRFLQRELPWLVQRGGAIRDRYRDVQGRRLAFYRSLVSAWIAAGVATPLPPERLDDLVLASWVVGDQWLAYLEAMGTSADEAEVRRGARLILEIFRPHLSEGAAEKLQAAL
jgi:AcrR family transcriptional regulator